jgi:tol-pal system protein YbgF
MMGFTTHSESPARRIGARAVVAALVFAALAVFAGPAQAASREQQQMMADLRLLQVQAQQLQVMMQTLNAAIKSINQRMDSEADLDRKAFADQKVLVNNLSSDVRVVREKLDESNVRITSLSQEMDAIRLAVQNVQRQMTPPATTTENGATPPAGGTTAPPSTTAPSSAASQPAAGGAPATGAQPGAPAGAAAAPATTAPAPAPALGMSPQRLYDSAWADFAAGQWDLAIQGFEAYLRTFPQSDLADDAQMNIGNSYYNSGKFQQALDAYDKVIQNYPGRNAVPDSYYKRGLTYRRLNQDDKAQESFAFVAQNFPDSDAGRLAKQQLEQLKKPSGGV